jgi:5-(aminomethyl)-3-furanmethanol phosphate kinase
MAPSERAVVVKLGGSLAAAGTLRSWLEVVIEHGAGRVVVVPGGGAFADAVREAQRRDGFSDLAAHRMAVLAMEQYAYLLLDLAPALIACAGVVEMRTALAGGAIALWLPSRMVWADPLVAGTWEVTSDSLAAWLARRLEASHLVLVKSVSAPAAATAAELATRGLVDPAFPVYAEAAGCAVTCCGPGEAAHLASVLALR